MPGYSTEIANEFIRRAQVRGIPLTHMQLQKLVYLAHGWTLAVLNRPLVSDPAQVWDYGPVYPSLYSALRRYGTQPVTQQITYADFDRSRASISGPAAAPLSDEERSLIDRVFETYGHFHAFQLSALTHAEGSPWQRVGVQNAVIPDALIRDYFVMVGRGGGGR